MHEGRAAAAKFPLRSYSYDMYSCVRLSLCVSRLFISVSIRNISRYFPDLVQLCAGFLPRPKGCRLCQGCWEVELRRA